MKAPQLETANPAVMLVAPDLERDAALGVEWLRGELGHNTLQLMGVPEKDNRPATIETERQRVRGFIENTSQLNWMIQYEGKVVGSVWVDLETREALPAPSVHIMIGDPAVRGKGLGFSSVGRVLDYLEATGHKIVYSRHLVENQPARTLLESLGFHDVGTVHTDHDGLAWQHVVRHKQE